VVPKQFNHLYIKGGKLQQLHTTKWEPHTAVAPLPFWTEDIVGDGFTDTRLKDATFIVKLIPRSR